MYYGFKLAGVLWVYYGLTLGMKAGAWGFFAPEISADVGLSATEIGLVAGIVFAGTAIFTPVAGFYISKYGCKRSMVIGLVLGAFGLALTSVSTSFYQFALGGALLAASTSFSGVVPLQTLTTMWFERYRSRAMAIIFTATPLWGALAYPMYDYMLNFMTWRGAVGFLTLIFPIGLVLVLGFVKNSPSEIGQPVDGLSPDTTAQSDVAGESSEQKTSAKQAVDSRWTTKSALLSPLFMFITLSVVVCTLPYLFFITYGRLLLESVNVSTDIAVAALASLTLATLLGRISASLADFFDARNLVLAALVSNLIGMLIVVNSQAEFLVYLSVFLMGASFGLSFLIAPILLARYFGKTVFAAVEGVRMSIVVGLNAILTPVFGYMIDLSGSYLLPFNFILAVNGIAMFGLVAQMLHSRFISNRMSADESSVK